MHAGQFCLQCVDFDNKHFVMRKISRKNDHKLKENVLALAILGLFWAMNSC